MKVNYNNMPNGMGKAYFTIRYFANILRTWYLFHFRFKGIKYHGFVRVMLGCVYPLHSSSITVYPIAPITATEPYSLSFFIMYLVLV